MVISESAKWSTRIVEEIEKEILIQDKFDELILETMNKEINSETIEDLFKQYLKLEGY
ncbi:MAG: hypothetical protein ACTSQY_08190 [Candidatus Odinarchaeia archaeon]